MSAIAAPTEQATARLAERLAPLLRPGDTVLLEGELGAGKTSFARALIRALMADPALVVPSPTFALVQPYEGRGRRILHIDLYRLEAPREAGELGLADDPEAIRLIEWPDRLPALFDDADFRVGLRQGAGPGARLVSVEAPADPGRLVAFRRT